MPLEVPSSKSIAIPVKPYSKFNCNNCTYMKHSIVILIFVLSLVASAYGQKTSDKPFRGATKVIVTNSLSATENFKRVGQAMIDLNYFIANKDSEYLALKSDLIFVSAPGGSFSQIIYVKVKETSIEFVTKVKFKGALSSNSGLDAFELLSWKNDYSEEYAFKNILSLFANIPHPTITYSE